MSGGAETRHLSEIEPEDAIELISYVKARFVALRFFVGGFAQGHGQHGRIDLGIRCWDHLFDFGVK